MNARNCEHTRHGDLYLLSPLVCFLYLFLVIVVKVFKRSRECFWNNCTHHHCYWLTRRLYHFFNQPKWTLKLRIKDRDLLNPTNIILNLQWKKDGQYYVLKAMHLNEKYSSTSNTYSVAKVLCPIFMVNDHIYIFYFLWIKAGLKGGIYGIKKIKVTEGKSIR